MQLSVYPKPSLLRQTPRTGLEGGMNPPHRVIIVYKTLPQYKIKNSKVHSLGINIENSDII